MTATFTWEHDDGNDYEIEIDYKIQPGAPRTWDYPGDPDEVDWYGFTCKANPAKAEEFEKLARDDNDLAHAVDQACFDAAEAAWELSQCDD